MEIRVDLVDLIITTFKIGYMREKSTVDLVDLIITTFKIEYMLEKSMVELVDKSSASVLGLYLWKSWLIWLT